MESNIGKWTAVILLSMVMLGCSSLRARTDIVDRNNEWKVYPGVRQDVKEMGRIVKGRPLKPDAERAEPGWVRGLVAVILVLDLPFSTVFDTLVAPYDLYRTYNPQDFRNDHAASEP